VGREIPVNKLVNYVALIGRWFVFTVLFLYIAWIVFGCGVVVGQYMVGFQSSVFLPYPVRNFVVYYVDHFDKKGWEDRDIARAINDASADESDFIKAVWL